MVGNRDLGRTTRDPGQPGVRLHCYLDVLQELNTQSPARCCSALTCHGRADSRVRTLALPTGGLGGRHGAVTRALPEPMLAAPVSDPALLPGWAGEPKLWMGFCSVRCPLRAWCRALRCEGPWTSGGVGSTSRPPTRSRTRPPRFRCCPALRGDAEVTVSGIARAASAARRI
ncbi:DUF6207 family protein [Streptomyces sp. uw30]|uniref:DUF6207 family protein n=1 Tax=Streptomyces sp. uw30 TaxID=1828179 RepID=UPI0021C9745B|nr:DUF6207 family protein [Streptomyces sp. uw30]